MQKLWDIGESNYVTVGELKIFDTNKMIGVCLADEDTSFLLVDEIKGSMIVRNSPLEFGFRFTDKNEEKGGIYLEPFVEISNARDSEVYPFHFKLFCTLLIEEVKRIGISYHEDHDKSDFYTIYLELPPILLNVGFQLEKEIEKVVEQGEDLFKRVSIQTIDNTIDELLRLRREYEKNIG